MYAYIIIYGKKKSTIHCFHYTKKENTKRKKMKNDLLMG